MSSSSSPLLELPPSIRVITLNCWGLKYLSTHRSARLTEIGHQLLHANPQPSLVALQECWTQADFASIHAQTASILPHAKFYFSGIFGGGLALLSRFPILESQMFRYPLNGRPAAVWRGDWFVGKGVACTRVRIGPGEKDVLEVFNTHFHAPYQEATVDTYLCHRLAQAWEVARLMRHAVERGHAVLGLGDFNSVPGSLAYRVVEAHAPVRDVWRVLWPDTMVGAAKSEAERKRVGIAAETPSVRCCVEVHGATCDSKLNTWRWSEEDQKQLLKRGKDREVDMDEPDEEARRLDYVFLGNAQQAEYEWDVESVQVGMTMRHPTLRCSLSDHFSVETTLVRKAASPSSPFRPAITTPLPSTEYDSILALIKSYTLREERQRKLRLYHCGGSALFSIACFVGIWWSPHNYVAFILLLFSTLGFGAGILDGLMGGLFVGSEVRALKEFAWEIQCARDVAVLKEHAGQEVKE